MGADRLGVLARLFGRTAIGHGADALYRSVVAEARRPDWYRDAGVPDTIDGRFDMLAAVTALALLRLQALGEPARAASAGLAELFVADMDGQLREQGIGDVVVGKHIGRMMGALGGRVAAFRGAFAGTSDLGDVVARNLRGIAGDRAPAVAAIRALHGRLDAAALDALLAGRIG